MQAEGTCTVVSQASAHFWVSTHILQATVAASIQMYGILIPHKRPCGPKLRVMFKRPWALTWDTTVYNIEQ